ncbi:MAG: xanthine dehydrogenase family protein molybdopterin-binding subunit [Mesorhizobium sp.]
MAITASQRRSTGSSQQRVDALAKARGEHVFPSDNALPGMLWLRIVRSTKVHARILAIDTQDAVRLDGVVSVLTAADIPGCNRFGLTVSDQPILCDEIVRFEGEPIAIVAAETDDIARRACGLVKVTYAELPVVDSAKTAKEMPDLHPYGNVCSSLQVGHGAIAAASRDCAHTVAFAYVTNRQEHAFLETEAGTSWVDGDGVLTLSVGGQNPFHDRRQIALALGLAEDGVRVLNPMMGGAFGGKEDCSVQIHLALVTHRTGRPARLMFDRQESLRAGVKRHEFNIAYRVGATNAGKLKYAEIELLADAGAYTTLTPAVLGQAAEHAPGPYRYEAVAIDGRAMFTNNGNASAFRGFGVPQISIGIEQVMDELARRTGLSPFEIRRRNLLQRGQTAGAGYAMSSDTLLPKMLDAAENGSLWQSRETYRTGAASWVRRGIGVSAIWQGYGLGADLEKGATVHLSLQENGRFCLEVGTPDLGSGNVTAFLQIAADELNSTVDHFDYIAGDSLGPNSGSSHASRTVYIVGNTVSKAGRELCRRIRAHGEATFGAEPSTLQPGFLTVGQRYIALSELATDMPDPEVVISFRPRLAKAIAPGIPHAAYSYWVQVLGVEVDTCTGEVSVTDVENYVDTGRTINPVGVLAQCEGGFVQGLGYALYENSIYAGGRLRNPTFANYVIPSVKDVPPNIHTTIFETPDETSPLGVRGIAEIGLSPVAATVANAVHDAIGARFERFPVLPEAVLNAIGNEVSINHA